MPVQNTEQAARAGDSTAEGRKMRLGKIFLITVGLLACAGFTREARAEDKPEVSTFMRRLPALVEQPNPDYLIGPGDVLSISVWEVEPLTRQITVLPDGKISFPLIGTLEVQGRTVNQLQGLLTEKISPYVPEPVVSVAVLQVNSMRIYVLGRVNRPGVLVLNARLSVLQALAAAGGLNPFAERDEIKIFREKDGETTVFTFDYDAVSEGEDLEQNIRLRRGDIVVVP
jgi:polysaccharide export outer membrane protein